jgi:DNA-binding Xre family transcriptional regulator
MPQFFIVTESLTRILSERDYSHTDLADALGITRSYWSLLYRRRRPLTPRMRRTLLSCEILQGVPRESLFECVEADGATEP